MKEEIYNRIKEAIDLVKDVPEEYKIAAFQVVLSHKISQNDDRPSKKQKKKVEKTEEIQHDINLILNSDFDWTTKNIPNLRPTLQNLEILRIAKNEFGIDELTANDIQAILSQKFRIHKTPNAINMSLMQEVGKHITRISKGRKLFYKITVNGIAYLDSTVMKMEK